MSKYAIKEIFYTLQGEGNQAGRAAIFVRFAGCNLWSGREEDRAKAICNFCDTDFVGTDGTFGGKFQSAEILADHILQLWPSTIDVKNYIVFTGGEPLLQLDEALITALKKYDVEIAIETNGTIEVPIGIDWICMSPKPNTTILVTEGNELKFVFPQKDLNPESFKKLNFDHYYIQPMDGPDLQSNIEKATQYCLENPQWRLSLQKHKILGLR